LEFDVVIVPHLQRKNRTEEAQLLLWLDRPSAHYTSDLILAPIKAKKNESDPIYNYLRQIEKQKSRYEMTRLLYVAVTRAKKSLYLLAEVEMKNNKMAPPSSDSFLSLLAGAFEKHQDNVLSECNCSRPRRPCRMQGSSSQGRESLHPCEL